MSTVTQQARGSAAHVPAFSLARQNRALRGEIGRALRAVVDDAGFILGERVARFEQEMALFTGIPHAVGVASGTDALLLALRALGVGPGDEVITTPFTFVATAQVVSLLGARPVFADIDPQTFNLRPQAVEAAVTPRTRAILPVHLYGRLADMPAIARIARRHDLAVVEDACQSVGARLDGGHAGTLGDAACLSFYPTKNLGAWGDGGMVLTRDAALADRLRRLRVHGSRRTYEHDEVGYCSRLDGMQAAVLSVKLRHLDELTLARRSVAARYDAGLRDAAGLATPPAAGPSPVYHQYTVRARRRDDLRAHLERRGVGSALYYPVPLHLQACFSRLGYGPGSFPEAEAACREVLSLPMWPELTAAEIRRVVRAVRSFAGATPGAGAAPR